MKHFVNLIARGGRVLGALLIPLALLLNTGVAHASTANSIYSYTFNSSSMTIPNAAASNSGATLNLAGNWVQSSYGVHFAGNTTTQQSGGYYRQSATSNTINVPASSSVGATVRFKYQAPASGSCFTDSPNISQIGLFAANKGQVKLQLSNCGNSSSNVYAQCRMAGANSPNTVLPVRSTLALVNGGDYIEKCSKTPDASGSATITLRVVKVDTTNGNTVQTDTFTVDDTGAITSAAGQYLSVANKYPFTAQANNTDQFVGDISKLAYCQASTVTAVQTCLDTENTEPAQVAPPVLSTTMTTDVTIAGIGQDIAYTLTTNNTVSGSTATGVWSELFVPDTMSVVNADGGSLYTFPSGQTYLTWFIGNLNGGASVVHHPVMQIDSGTLGSTVGAYEFIAMDGGGCGTGGTCSVGFNITIGEPVINTTLGLSSSSLTVGSNMTYTTTTSNAATASKATGVWQELLVPTNMSVVDADGGAPYTFANGATYLTWYINVMNPGASVTHHAVLKLDSGTVGNNQYAFVFTALDGGNCGTGGVCSASAYFGIVAPPPAPVLAATMSVDPTTAAVGDNVTYTFTSNNTATGSTANVSGYFTIPTNMTVVDPDGGTVYPGSNNDVIIWDLGTMAGGNTPVSRHPVLRVNSGNVNDVVTAGAQVATDITNENVDGCENGGSCYASADYTIVAGATTEWVLNPGVETNLTGWGSKYGNGSHVSVVRTLPSLGGHTGAADILVTGTTGASNEALGFSDTSTSRWVENSNNTKTYNASVWVKASFTGQSIVLRLKELQNGTSTVVSGAGHDIKSATFLAPDTNWHQLTASISPTQNSDQLTFAVYAEGMNVGTTFEADDMSYTTNN